jgi:hypothetical protein
MEGKAKAKLITELILNTWNNNHFCSFSVCYRGLKSFRSSPWDAREGLPAEYGRVFAFENFKRTAKRAREAAVSRNTLSPALRMLVFSDICHTIRLPSTFMFAVFTVLPEAAQPIGEPQAHGVTATDPFPEGCSLAISLACL